MAREVQILLKDDIDGTEAERNVGFSLDGVEYEIDLSKANIAKLTKAMEPWIAGARRVRSNKPRGNRRRAAAEGPSTNDVRIWARENGYVVSDRGRIPAAVMAAYEAAH
ncbi:Lsr2 family protein [Arachnia propionica]|uniref:Lsr2 family protein n=1 Tax=Arachnia propionica TaxID=1750 RepID=A0A3P1T8B6_9ACTN|nr:Lsr2 family protein [Arachnia propionica]MDO5083794.1 Lsr2 family protein [Arachnia propionica]RRD05425.1 Lsr2 family protein [Arachnia propionica]